MYILSRLFVHLRSTFYVLYYLSFKEQWSQVGIGLTLEPKESVSIIPIAFAASYEQLFALFYAPPSQIVMWWPWLKNYSGELSVGYFSGDSWVRYVWVDQAMKKSMGR
jgi:hypothetical protein